MISIKRFLDPESREAAEAFESMAWRLLHAIGQHAVKGENSEFESFQTTIEGMEAGLKKDPSPENILVTAGSAVGVLESYNRRTAHSITAKSVELHAIVGILTQAMSQIASDSQKSIERLQELQKNIEHAAIVEDLRALKFLLSDWVQSIQGEVRHQRDESSRAIADLKQSLRQSQESKPSEAETCMALSLPPRLDAKAAIAAACEDRSRTYAGLFVLDRFHATNARFGPALGEQVLDFFMQLLLQGLGPSDKLFRWDDDSFLTLAERSEPVDQVRQALGRTPARRAEHTFNADGRSVSLLVSSTWLFVPLFEHSYAENLRKLEGFSESIRRA